MSTVSLDKLKGMWLSRNVCIAFEAGSTNFLNHGGSCGNVYQSEVSVR